MPAIGFMVMHNKAIAFATFSAIPEGDVKPRPLPFDFWSPFAAAGLRADDVHVVSSRDSRSRMSMATKAAKASNWNHAYKRNGRQMR